MKNKLKHSTLIWFGLLVAFATCLFAACSKMNDTYKDFIQDGQMIYPGKADSARVLSGRNRLILAWPASTDPKVTKARIYWNNMTDSIEIPVKKKSAEQDTISVPFNDLPEGTYVFEIVTFDRKGNRSVKVEAVGKVYGDVYENSLLSRPVDAAVFSNDTLEIVWGGLPDTTVIGSEVLYIDLEGTYKTLFIPKTDLTTQIPEYMMGNFDHRTLYLPNEWAVDTFYTEYATQRVKGPPIELSKEGWTATASSFDSRPGSSYRPASNAIDGDPTSLWVNQISPQEIYPHTITIDMGSIHDEIEGFAVITRVGDAAARPRTVELLTSENDIDWHNYGEYILEDSGDKQFIALPEVVNARYFQMIAKDAHRGGDNIALAEIGVYTR